jgi:hypothetical protein
MEAIDDVGGGMFKVEFVVHQSGGREWIAIKLKKIQYINRTWL